MDSIIKKQQNINNSLVNQNERNNTMTSYIPKKSTFDKSFQQATTFNSGKLIPVLLQECYPGDIYEIDTNALIRLSAQASTPFMNINYDINYFFIPFSQIDKEFHQLMGENNEYGYSDTEINFPQLNYDTDFRYFENDLANYFNIPINKNFNGDKINLYPFLAYGKVWNEWYRDQNLQGNIDITSWNTITRELNVSKYREIAEGDFYSKIIFGKELAPTSKLPSYFTTNLPYQQKGLPISLGKTITNLIVDNDTNKTNLFSPTWFNGNSTIGENGHFLKAVKDGTQLKNATAPETYIGKANIALKASGNIIAPTINELRYSIVSQHLLENWALCGSRYVEQLKSIWGIEIDPKQINRTELIGGINDSLEFTNVVQTSETTNNSPLGNISSNLYNSVNSGNISYAATQHGYILGVMTCRTRINNGGQGMPKLFKYKSFLDLFNPIFNGIGEQPTKSEEIYYNDSNKEKNKLTFGFNEPFLNTKYNIDNANGFFSLNSHTTLFPIFLFGEKYDDTPMFNDHWMRYNENIIGSTLFNVSENTKQFYHQFISIFTFKIKYTTAQPLFNSPRVYGI